MAHNETYGDSQKQNVDHCLEAELEPCLDVIGVDHWYGGCGPMYQPIPGPFCLVEEDLLCCELDPSDCCQPNVYRWSGLVMAAILLVVLITTCFAACCCPGVLRRRCCCRRRGDEEGVVGGEIATSLLEEPLLSTNDDEEEEAEGNGAVGNDNNVILEQVSEDAGDSGSNGPVEQTSLGS